MSEVTAEVTAEVTIDVMDYITAEAVFDTFLDEVSQQVTGSPAGLINIDVKPIGVNEDGTVRFKVTGTLEGEINGS